MGKVAVKAHRAPAEEGDRQHNLSAPAFPISSTRRGGVGRKTKRILEMMNL